MGEYLFAFSSALETQQDSVEIEGKFDSTRYYSLLPAVTKKRN
jgi:hypothetical protein